MKGYLLDTNAVHKWSTQDAIVVAHVTAAGTARIETSVVTLGETACGHLRNPSSNPARRAACVAWIAGQFIKPLDVTKHTSEHYGEIKAELFRLFPPIAKTRFVDGCFDHVSGATIGIDENDVWLAAQAIEHNLILISSDKMKRIKTAAGHTLVVENWEIP